MRLLFIDDEPKSVEPVISNLKTDGSISTCQIDNFSQVEETMDRFNPDVVILDLVAGGFSSEPKAPGVDVYDQIWKNRFCPIIVYSAHPELIEETKEKHPFVSCIKKGSRSVSKLKAKIEEMRPHVVSLHEAEKHILKEFALALREVAPYAFKAFTDSTKRSDAIQRSGRRRVAALMDDLSRHGEKLASWEKYLCPPVSADPKLGDVLRKADGSATDSSSFRIVLTPSCDMVSSPGRSPKVENVLVACCIPIKEGLQKVGAEISASPSIKKDAKKNLSKTVLSQGYFKTIIPFPALPDRIPSMAAYLQKLELIPLNNIGLESKPYLRIASIDSPFREMISWAYMQNACRPGLPDRDLEAWCEEIIAT